jgi:hypothetical protein
VGCRTGGGVGRESGKTGGGGDTRRGSRGCRPSRDGAGGASLMVVDGGDKGAAAVPESREVGEAEKLDRS